MSWTVRQSVTGQAGRDLTRDRIMASPLEARACQLATNSVHRLAMRNARLPGERVMVNAAWVRSNVGEDSFQLNGDTSSMTAPVVYHDDSACLVPPPALCWGPRAYRNQRGRPLVL